MAKKGNNKNNKIIEENTTQISLKSVITLFLCVLVVFLGFYIFTLYMTHQENDDSSTDDTSSVDTSSGTILLGQTLSMNYDSYYVLFYDFDDEDNASNYQNIITQYKSKEDGLPIYSVDMSSGFNKSYKTDGESNKNPNSISDFSINGITLMKIENKAVVDYVEGEESITSILS